MEKGVLRKVRKFTGKHLCQSLCFNKVAGLGTATLLKKRLWHRCFPVNFAKFLRTPFLQNTSGRLLLLFMFCFFSILCQYYKDFQCYLLLLFTPKLRKYKDSICTETRDFRKQEECLLVLPVIL